MSFIDSVVAAQLPCPVRKPLPDTVKTTNLCMVLKSGDIVLIGDSKIYLTEVGRNRVKLLIQAPKSQSIRRK